MNTELRGVAVTYLLTLAIAIPAFISTNNVTAKIVIRKIAKIMIGLN